MPCLNFSIISNVRSFFTKSKKAFTEKVNLEVVNSAIKAAKEKFKVESKKIFKKLWGPIGNLLKNINLKAPNVFAGKNEASQSVGIAHHANDFNFEAEVGATRDNDESGRY